MLLSLPTIHLNLITNFASVGKQTQSLSNTTIVPQPHGCSHRIGSTTNTTTNDQQWASFDGGAFSRNLGRAGDGDGGEA